MSPIHVTCRQCGADVDKSCINPDGVVMVYFHRIRFLDAASKQEEQRASTADDGRAG